MCCIFIITAGQTVITQNCTYVQNENFPSGQPNTNAIQYTVQKCADGKSHLVFNCAIAYGARKIFAFFKIIDVCLLLLDFENFNIIGAGGTGMDNEGDCMDTFTVTVQPVPSKNCEKICMTICYWCLDSNLPSHPCHLRSQHRISQWELRYMAYLKMHQKSL